MFDRPMNVFLIILLSCTTSLCFAQVQTFYVRPVQTDSNYDPAEDSSAVSRNTGFQVNKLYLFMGGSNSSSSVDYNGLRLHAANLGYDVINLSYPNTVAVASMADSNDSLVFDKYRQELCFGTPVSDEVAVDTLNSISTRTLKLIQYLDQSYPADGWGQYLAAPNALDWSKIIVGGHSQGSGHAAYLAKHFLVDRVLMFAGPNDYSNTFSNAAHWLRQAGNTPPSRHYAFLSLNDEIVPFFKQFVNIAGLGLLANDDSTYVDNSAAPYDNSRFLYTTQPPGLVLLNHNVPIRQSTINLQVWTYMLSSGITTGVEAAREGMDITVYPNPANDRIFLGSGSQQGGIAYSLHSLTGQLLKHGMLDQGSNSHAIDISDLVPGAYLLRVNGVFRMVVKE